MLMQIECSYACFSLIRDCSSVSVVNMRVVVFERHGRYIYVLMLTDRLIKIRSRISAACERAGRSPDSVKIVAVTKSVPVEEINRAIELGLTDIGENRVQEYLNKRPLLKLHEFHMIGHLQRNKVKTILPFCGLIHSVDSIALAEEINRRAEAEAIVAKVLLEVNVSGEDSKQGVPPAGVNDLAKTVLAMPNLLCAGLMTVAEQVEDPEMVRPSFRMLHSMLRELNSAYPSAGLCELSMGMTGDYETAIEEGATMIRIGTAIFGMRQ